MTSKLPQFNFRCEQETIDKIKYIADKEVRSASQEIVHLMKKRIERYEEDNGKITKEDLIEFKNKQDRKTKD